MRRANGWRRASRSSRPHGDLLLINRAQLGLLQVLVAVGDVETVKRIGPQALAISQQLGDRWSEHFAHHFLGDVAVMEGDVAEAERRYRLSLHFTNAYEDGDEIVVDGFFQGDPEPADNGMGNKWQRAFRFLALDRMQAPAAPLALQSGDGSTLREEQLSDCITEFGMINAGYAGGKYRYTYAATGKPGWFLFDGLMKHDLEAGIEQRFAFGDGVYGSETAMAPRVGSAGEDDGYLVTLTTDMTADASFCLVFDAARVGDGPVCKLVLPERISSGTHSTWAAGSQLRRWRETDSAAAAIGL